MRPTALDPAILAELRNLQCDGGPNILGELAKLFIETMDAPVEKLRAAAASKNFAELAATAHMLKSGSANVGALRLSEISKLLETAGDKQDPSALTSLLSEFNNEFAVVIEELKRL